MEEQSLEEQFRGRWPGLFRDVEAGFYLPACWRDHVWRLCLDLEASGLDPEVRCVQVKEKFGGLRFYVRGPVTEAQHELIDRAESATLAPK